MSEASAALELCLHGLCGCCAGGDYPPCEPCLQLHLEHDAAVQRFLDDVASIQARHEHLRGEHPSWDRDIALVQHLTAAAGQDPGELVPRDDLVAWERENFHDEIPIGKRWVVNRYPELEALAYARGPNLAFWRDHRAILEQMHPEVPPLAWAQLLDDVDAKRRAS